MSTKTYTVWTCDRCEREGEHYNTLGRPRYFLGVTWLQWFQKREVCKRCYEEFEQWFFGARFPRKGETSENFSCCGGDGSGFHQWGCLGPKGMKELAKQLDVTSSKDSQ